MPTLLLLLCAFTALAQEPVPVFRTGSRLVEMTVVVQDEKGNPVTGLTKDDFTLTDDGKTQSIAVFDAHNGPGLARPAAALPAGFFSNRLEYSGGAPSAATVILIDLLNSPPGYWGRARPHLEAFLRKSDPRTRLGIYLLNRKGLQIVHDIHSPAEPLTTGMTADMTAFVQALGDPAGANAALTGRGGDGFAIAAMLAARSAALESALYEPMDGLQAAEAMQIIARRLGGVPGRKNLVWVSTGFSRISNNSIGRVSEAFDGAVRALSNASVAVYPVDARGIMAFTDNLVTVEPKGRPVRFQSASIAPKITMQEMANRTGGKLFYGEEIDQALPQVFTHARSFYTIGYYPTDGRLDGKFHTVRVRVQRSRAKVTHRAGYYAAEEPPREEQRRAELTSAVWSPADATAIGFDAALERDSGTPPDARRLVIVLDGDRMSGRMDLLVVQKNAEGKQVEGTLDTFEAKAQGQRITHRKDLRLKPDAVGLRVVLRNSAGALGSLSIPLASGTK